LLHRHRLPLRLRLKLHRLPLRLRLQLKLHRLPLRLRLRLPNRPKKRNNPYFFMESGAYAPLFFILFLT
jgi:hypothetical protein